MIGRNRGPGTGVVPAMRTPQRRLVPLLVPLVATLAVACGQAPTSRSPSVPPGPLVTIEVRGGECPQGACGQTTAIERDGRVHVTSPEPAELSTLAAPILESLTAEVESADFEALAARPFTGECPTAFDGQEIVFTFVAPSGTHRLASCEVEIDFRDPLFSVAMDAVALDGTLP